MPWELDKSHADNVESGIVVAFEQAITIPVDGTCLVIYVGCTKLGVMAEGTSGIFRAIANRRRALLSIARDLEIRKEDQMPAHP